VANNEVNDMNQMTLEKLQYGELKELVKAYCVSGLGRTLVDKLAPSSNIEVVRNRLNETTEARAILDSAGFVPFFGITNIANLIDQLEKGQILEPADLVSLSDFLRGCDKLKTFMLAQEFYAPTLSGYAHSMSAFKEIEDEINHAITGNIVDSNASKELKRIRNKIDGVEAKINERLTKFLNNPNHKKHIQDNFISKRGDHFTIPIKAASRNLVPGTVIEVSAKGSTVFMEPDTVMKYSGELTDRKSVV
jgi:dsDNA-specific endonuclease/ATPase MutS2